MEHEHLIQAIMDLNAYIRELTKELRTNSEGRNRAEQVQLARRIIHRAIIRNIYLDRLRATA